MAQERRTELDPYIDYLKHPGHTVYETLLKFAIGKYLRGHDAEKALMELTKDRAKAEKMARRARTWLKHVRNERKARAHEILSERQKPLIFTFENFSVNIDSAHDKDSGMTQVSIYSVIEVLNDDEEQEKEYLVNFSDYKTKEWLTRLLVWGLMNKKEIIVKPAVESDLTTMRMFVPKEKPA